eukprot:SAG22_NODE_51_length_24458_cov_19.853161_1_plen_464_part_10
MLPRCLLSTALVVLAAAAGAQGQGVPDADRDALLLGVVFVPGMNQRNWVNGYTGRWINGTNWINGTDVCGWRGVTCNNSRVAGVDLGAPYDDDYHPVVQSLGELFGDLQALTILDLGGNRLITLPESFGDLPALTTLDLSANHFSTLPESFGDLQALTTLDLSINPLRTLPESFGDLQALTTLYLNHNQLSTLPESFGDLQALSTLVLRFNELSTLPDSFGDLQALSTLDLSENQLSALPESFGDLHALTTLGLGSNQLSTLPEWFGDLQALTTLGLGSNQLSTLPESFGDLKALTTLYLHTNPSLKSFPGVFDRIHNLTQFSADPNFNPCEKLRTSSGGSGTPFRCVCETGYYDGSRGQVQCFDADRRFDENVMAQTFPGCEICPPCVQCTEHDIALKPGYGLRFEDPPVLSLVPAESVAVFNCPVNGSCAGGPTTNCSTGYTGALCGECAAGYGRRGGGKCA